MAPWFETLYSARLELEDAFSVSFNRGDHGYESDDISVCKSKLDALLDQGLAAFSSLYPNLILIAKFFHGSHDIAGFAVFVDGARVAFSMDQFDFQLFASLMYEADLHDDNTLHGQIMKSLPTTRTTLMKTMSWASTATDS